MTNDREVTESAATEPAPRFRVFISHTHADRALARALGELVADVFSGTVEPWYSSDPSPTGGIVPGEQPFQRIDSRLLEANAVWVLATSKSIERPWIYWEAGRGTSVGRGPVVVRIGLTNDEVPSPLSIYQTYDGTKLGDEEDQGIGTMLKKAAAQFSIRPADDVVNLMVKKWLDFLRGYDFDAAPDEEVDAQELILTPEDIRRVDAVISRLESTAAQLGGAALGLGRNWPEFSTPRRRRELSDLFREELNKKSATRIIEIGSAPELARYLDSIPLRTPYQLEYDDPGDEITVVMVDANNTENRFILKGDWIDDARPKDYEAYDVRTVDILSHIRLIRERRN